MTFDVAGDAYGQFMGRYSEPLAGKFVEWLAPEVGERVLDVGCGPGALTARLVEWLGSEAVSAVDPSEPLLGALRTRLPDVDARLASAEDLPFDSRVFDRTAAQLVVHFMRDPVAGLAEMRRVTRPGGWVAACVWDHAGERSPLSPFWRAVRALDPAAGGEDDLPGVRRHHLAELGAEAGLTGIEETELEVTVPVESFEAFWAPYLNRVGPAGDYVAHLAEDQRQALMEKCRELLPPAPFEITAVAWAAKGRA